jgi:hypothetical protein
MRKAMAIILGIIFCVSLFIPAQAAISTDRPVRVIHQTRTADSYATVEDIHRVVMGWARKEISPNFLDNDWEDWGFFSNQTGEAALGDSSSSYTSGNTFLSLLTPSEAAYLSTITGLAANTNYYIDMTAQVIQTTPFEDYTYNSTSTGTSSTVQIIDPYTTIVTDTVITIVTTNNVVYQIICQVYDHSPLVLDLSGDGKIQVARNQWMPHAPKFYPEFARYFDMVGDGSMLYSEWVAPGIKDGFLVKPEDGRVESALQLFGTAGGYRDGFEKLSHVCDTDKNGWVEGPELQGLALWIDSNSDAICQEDELKPLHDYGITRISTASKDYLSRFTTREGREFAMWDWWPASMEVRRFKR